MGYGLENNEQIFGKQPDIVVLEDDIAAAAIRVPGGEGGVAYPAVSVIIPTYMKARLDWLKEAVASVQAQTVSALETIVVVDHNPELLAEISREFPDVIAVPNIGGRGVSGARNSGVKASHGEVVAFLDDDSIARNDWLATLLRHVMLPGVVGAGCYSDGLWETPCPSWFPGEFGWTIGVSYSGLPSKPAAVRNVWTSAMLVKRSAFENVDGFREDFGKIGNRSLPEDTDLCLRIAAVQENAIWIWDPEKVMQHRVPAGRATFGYLMSRCFLQGWGKAAMAHMDGFGQSTSAERNYALCILPAGFARGVKDALRGDISGLGRSGAIAAAFSVTVAGYLWYLVEGLFRKRSSLRSSVTSSATA